MGIYRSQTLVQFRLVGDETNIPIARKAVCKALYSVSPDVHQWSSQSTENRSGRVEYSETNAVPKSAAKQIVAAVKEAATASGARIFVSYPSIKKIRVIDMDHPKVA